ncbi:MAG TPA: MarR family winged helix-turn-helix transcriptional regulator [Spirochaetota bacterium]|nr:MarR family winged helix-turn-helix transcriptional regulator [Spirochaetota bacterium]HPL15672.1 MarR family winged helix-turn-helix transcriptional regulator [Spirochaetota bacterium]HQF09297.1 MarR family winged helix-turn-helix transcriptional regulator [Spirochaetota bacterium]HQH98245.1 MarR family winged helix-turn-helix transcriptional regulator [Spirochaetota bacterium]HQJ70404.1 MarR family winged helix-turn-helix transcriptional regulator [Spirochaetota bacterium]
MNKFNKLVKRPIDFGTGDLLYPGEIHTIDEIGKNNGKTVTELCAIFGVTKGAVSQLIARIEEKGYVKKIRNEDFGKEKIISLTQKGRKAFEAHARLHNAVDDDFVKHIGNVSVEEVEQFKRILSKIEGHVDKYLAIGEK